MITCDLSFQVIFVCESNNSNKYFIYLEKIIGLINNYHLEQIYFCRLFL